MTRHGLPASRAVDPAPGRALQTRETGHSVSVTVISSFRLALPQGFYFPLSSCNDSWTLSH